MKIKVMGVETVLSKRGITFEIRDNGGKHVGYIVFSKGGLQWYKTKYSRNKVLIRWTQLISFFEEQRK